ERPRARNPPAGRLKTGTRPRNARSTGTAARSKRARYALWKNPSDLTDRQQHELDWIAKTDPKLWRASLLQEAVLYVFAARGDEGKEALRPCLIGARRSQLPAFVDLHRKITAH